MLTHAGITTFPPIGLGDFRGEPIYQANWVASASIVKWDANGNDPKPGNCGGKRRPHEHAIMMLRLADLVVHQLAQALPPSYGVAVSY